VSRITAKENSYPHFSKTQTGWRISTAHAYSRLVDRPPTVPWALIWTSVSLKRELEEAWSQGE
jgi:hypothetical protein